MSDFFHTPKVADKAVCEARWSCGEPGQFFRCGLCGHKFIIGDEYTIIFTNDMPKAGGNPIVCKTCNGNTTEETRQKWKAHCAEFAVSKEKFWFFHKRT